MTLFPFESFFLLTYLFCILSFSYTPDLLYALHVRLCWPGGWQAGSHALEGHGKNVRQRTCEVKGNTSCREWYFHGHQFRPLDICTVYSVIYTTTSSKFGFLHVPEQIKTPLWCVACLVCILLLGLHRSSAWWMRIVQEKWRVLSTTWVVRMERWKGMTWPVSHWCHLRDFESKVLEHFLRGVLFENGVGKLRLRQNFSPFSRSKMIIFSLHWGEKWDFSARHGCTWWFVGDVGNGVIESLIMLRFSAVRL